MSTSRPPSLVRVLVARFMVVVFVVLLALNIPLYAGGSIDGFRLRMEHGRILAQRSDAISAKAPWIDVNTEGLRWRPGYTIHSPDDWRVLVPLWIPLGVAMAEAWWLGRKRRSAKQQAAAQGPALSA